MAKITINGQNLLQDLNDDWGGENNSGSTQNIHGTPVPNGSEWGMNRGEVERFLKEQIGGKVGFFIWSDVDENNYYHLWGFATEADYNLYITDTELHHDLLLYDRPLFISTVQGDSYSAFLFREGEALGNIVLSQPSLPINLKFCAVKNSEGQRINTYNFGTLYIERSTDNGSTWSRVGTVTGLNSQDYTSVVYDTSVDVGEYLLEGAQLIRVRASFTYEDEYDQPHIVYSTWINIASRITYTQLRLQCQLDWNNALQASELNGTFPLRYMAYGATPKTFHYKITGYNGTLESTVSLVSGTNGETVNIDVNATGNNASYRLLRHGIRTVETWLTASDGYTNTPLESEHLVNRFMVIDYDSSVVDGTTNQPFLMLQNVKEEITNFVQEKIFEYAIFNPSVSGTTISSSNDPLNISFYLTAYDDSFSPSGSTMKYLESTLAVTPNEQFDMTTTVEIETDSLTDIDSYLRVWWNDNGTMKNLMLLSQEMSEIYISVDNSENFSPTQNASFILNPKVRNNSELQPARIINAVNGSVVGSTWTGFDMVSDGWVQDVNGVKVLRVLAGETLEISLNPFAQFLNAPNSTMTMEFDIAVRNVTNEDDPILRLLETVGGNPRGLSIRPMEGNLFTMNSTTGEDTNFRFCEDKRTHISININNSVVPSYDGDGLYDPQKHPNPASSIALARIFINGNIEREIEFDTSSTQEFCTNANNKILIGQTGADIDIYGIRVYGISAGALSAKDIVRNYVATLPTTAEKRKTRLENDIMDGNRVSLAKVQALGKRCLVLHGDEPYFDRTEVGSIWWEIFQYNEDGTLNKDLSGKICERTGMPVKRQGTTANSYYYSNIQTKIDDKIKVGNTKVTRWIYIDRSQFHSSITVGEPYTSSYTDPDTDETTADVTVVDILGGNLGKNEPVTASMQSKKYLVVNGQVRVPDGWFDGNDKYRGIGYMVAEGTPLATKLVLKVNYASSMQSHLCGGTRLYSDLHTAVVGKNAMQLGCPTARVAKYTEPVYFFTQATNNSPILFRGGGNFGAGKMDKPTWGYAKSPYPMFAMFEGADNNMHMTDMRVPFITSADPNMTNADACPEHIIYDDEAYWYQGKKNLDFDGGATDDNEVPVSALTATLANAWNFIYLHSPMLRFYNGNMSSFLNSSESNDTSSKFWIIESRGNTTIFRLLRWQYGLEEGEGQWVDAGLWNGSGYDEIDLKTDPMTASTWNNSTNKHNYTELNKEFIAAIVAHAKKYIGFYFNVSSLQFHYVLQNHFMAGTDNCSKNTYYVIDPQQKSVTIDGETRPCYLFELHQDDVDTIFITDNNGHSTKPYYVDRMHPYPDGGNVSTYQGENNVLFDLVEKMYEDTGELAEMLRAVFNAMTDLVTSADTAKGITKSIWGCLEKYFFSIQHFYSQMAYNEQARIRYEWPALLGFVSQQKGARTIRPITQSMGSQLEAETQYMIRRVVYMASYAAWGEFASDTVKSIGIAGANETFSWQCFQRPNTPPNTTDARTYELYVTPHQYIYPTALAGTSVQNPHVRVAPGEQYHFVIGVGETSNDTGYSMLGADYYRSFGNMGDVSTYPDTTFIVKGKRLVEFIAIPTVTYVENGKTIGAFRPQQIRFDSPLLRTIRLGNQSTGCGASGAMNLTLLTRLETADFRHTYIYDVTLPSSIMLREVHFPDTISRLVLRNLINLQVLDIGGLSHLATLEADQTTVNVDIKDLILRAKNEGAPLTNVTANVNWDDCTTELLDYLVGLQTSNIRGTIAVSSSSVVTFEQKKSYLRWGNIDDPNNILYISYVLLNIDHIFIKGQKYFNALGTTQFDITAEEGNNVAIVNGTASVTWSIQGNPYIEITNASTGAARIKGLNPAGDETRYTLTVVVDLIDNTTVTATWKVGAFMRLPKRGDFAYADGSFDDEVIGGKTMVGIAYEVADLISSGVVVGRTVSVCSMKYDRIISKDSSISQLTKYWGVCAGNANDCIPTALVQEISAASNNVDLLNINLGAGQTDGGSKRNTDSIMEVVSAVIKGYMSTMWNNTDLSQYQSGTSAGEYAAMQRAKDLASRQALPSTPEELGDMMEAFRAKKRIDGDSIPSRYDMLFYPLAHSTRLYEPVVKIGETLHNSYKRGSWSLWSAGAMTKIAKFNWASKGKAAANTVSSQYVNENQSLSDDDYPLFANMFKRMEDAGVPLGTFEVFIQNSNNIYHQSSTAGVNKTAAAGMRFYDNYYNTYSSRNQLIYSRAVTTFTFMID